MRRSPPSPIHAPISRSNSPISVSRKTRKSSGLICKEFFECYETFDHIRGLMGLASLRSHSLFENLVDGYLPADGKQRPGISFHFPRFPKGSVWEIAQVADTSLLPAKWKGNPSHKKQKREAPPPLPVDS